MSSTVKNKIQNSRMIACDYDELTENNLYNQIIKTTILILIKSDGVKSEHKQGLKRAVLFFNNVDTINPSMIQWNCISIRKSNKSYEMLLNICYFVIDGLLQTTDKGSFRMASFSDEHMEMLFQKFVFNYFYQHYHHKELSVNAAQIKWDLTGAENESAIKYLPLMQTDITLKHNNNCLIIDTKYYSRTMQNRFDGYKYHSANMYQIYTYVKNMSARFIGRVSGMLLYARSGEIITPNAEYMMGENMISIKTLDLNTDFRMIAKQLDDIAERFILADKPEDLIAL